MIVHYTPRSLFLGLSCNPKREYGAEFKITHKKRGHPTQLLVDVNLFVWKRSLGFKIADAGEKAGIKEATARNVAKRLGIALDRRISAAETKSSAVHDYLHNRMNCVEISSKYGVGVSTAHRWVRESGGSTRSISEAKALQASKDPCGKDVIGKKSLFHTNKGDRWIPTDSVYEYARLSQHEANPCVIDVDRCPFRIPYKHDGKLRHYTPDFLVTLAGGERTVEEVKPSRWARDPVVMAKAAAATEFLVAHGIGYVVVSEPDIGVELIKSCSDEVVGRQNSEYRSTMLDRRRAAKRDHQKSYYRKMRASLTPEQEIDYKAKMAGYVRASRKRKATPSS